MKDKTMHNSHKPFRTLLRLAWPVMVEEALTTIVQYIDAAMVGRLGAFASAAVGLTSTVTWLVNAPLWALGTGVLAILSREYGAGNHEQARRASVQSIWLSVFFGLILTVLTLGISPVLPAWMGADPAIRAPASAYFSIICLPLIARSLIIVLGSTLRAVRDTRTPMRVSLLINLINIVLNALLIFPARTMSLFGLVLPLPGMDLGVTGAAIATNLSYLVGGCLMLAALWRNPLTSPAGKSLRPDPGIIRQCLRITLPAALTRIISCLGHVVFSAQVTRLGTQALAAHSLALTAEEGFYIPGYGLQAAVSTLSGNAAGSRDMEALRRTCRTGLALSIGIMCLTGFTLFLIPVPMMRLFTADPGVIADGASVLRIVAFSEPFFGAAIILEGVFDGISDTKTPLLYSLISMWAVRIALTQVCLSVFHLYLNAVWLCMVLGNITYLLLLSLAYARGRWRRFVTG